MKAWIKRARMAGVAGLSAAALSACASDPETWEGVAMGLNMVADEIAAENDYRAQCYPKSLSGMSIGNATYPDMLCPGDYGYNYAIIDAQYYAPSREYRRRGHRHDRDDDDRRRDRRN